ncbi:MAG: hypothetical protein GX055_04460, partial [Desulfovibrionales bacterium]|nr:hypothetical protein [Desulfovibrionales bacterium]
MRRLAFVILLFFVTVSSHAGFKFYGAGGQFMDSADDPDDSAPQEYESSVPALPISPAQSVKKPA